MNPIQSQLTEPFDPAEIKYLPKTVKENRCLAMPYIDARLVQDRLDDVVGVVGWQDDYTVLPSGDVVCRLSIKVDSEWIVKTDVGSLSDQPDAGDKLKAAFSDALKRAAVKFGVGRYLYRIKPQWVDYDTKTKQVATRPPLPDFAIPASHKPCGTDFATRLRGLMTQLAEAVKRPATQVASENLNLVGLPPGTKLSQIPSGKAKTILQTLNEALLIAAKQQPQAKSA